MYGASGLEWKILFSQQGYTPHCAEHLLDPADGREKLLMFDPHTFKGVLVYDLADRRLEWEFKVPGSRIPNPHQGFMLREDRPGFGRKGDICCCDGDNNIIVVERGSRDLKFSKKPGGFQVRWLHCVNTAADGNLIATDYAAPRVSKLSVPDLGEMWSRSDIPKPSKVMPIEGKGFLHNPSFGGDYVVASNTFEGRVYEIRDADGAVAWSNDREGVLCDIACPHGCLRMGRIENLGSVTLVHGEGDGAIAGLNYEGMPVFGVMPGTAWERQDGTVRYDFNPYLLGEITGLFPTLHGRIGFCSWSGVNRAAVGEILHFPSRQRVGYRLKSGTTGDEFAWSHLVPMASWDETFVVIRNTGGKWLDYQVDGYIASSPRLRTDPEWGRLPSVYAGRVSPGGFYHATVAAPCASLRLGVKSAVAGESTDCEVWISQKRA